MIVPPDPEPLRTIRNSVCGVGYLTIPIAEYVKDLRRPYFKVVGTGFAVRTGTAITNRHVIQALLDKQKENGFPDEQRVIMFVVPEENDQWHVGFASIGKLGFLTDQALDVGFCDFSITGSPFVDRVLPPKLRTDEHLEIGHPVFVVGYPYGHLMLHRDNKVYRWGPVIQTGIISALSPFDSAKEPDEILLDVRAAGGMSGAPIYSAVHEKVIGILHSVWEATTALALPLRQDAVERWLAEYDKGFSTVTQP